MIPLWLLKAAPYVGAVLLVGGAVWYIDHRGYQRAEAESVARDNERKLFLKDLEIMVKDSIHDSELKMQSQLLELDSQLGQRIDDIDSVNKTIIQPTLVKEIASDPRLSDPSLGITDIMRTEINRARSLSQRPCPAGADAGTCFTLSSPHPAQ